MDNSVLGIHHVTAIAGDPQRNMDFYSGLLGLRLVKFTVNFDDPTAYHLYYGDGVGHPGTILTFFTWPGAPMGRLGAGQVEEIAFSIPEDAITFWTNRLGSRNIKAQSAKTRLGETLLAFTDPDGLRLQLIAHKESSSSYSWKEGPIKTEYALRGFYGVTILEASDKGTSSLLTKTMGFNQVARAGDLLQYDVGKGGPGTHLDLLTEPGTSRGVISVGTVHHIAWRTPSDEHQHAWREKLLNAGMNVTPIIDRKYFHSIYYREPGGVLFEIATDPPGFMIDEPVEQLGTRLMLPPWLEPRRQELMGILPPVNLPEVLRAQ